MYYCIYLFTCAKPSTQQTTQIFYLYYVFQSVDSPLVNPNNGRVSTFR